MLIGSIMCDVCDVYHHGNDMHVCVLSEGQRANHKEECSVFFKGAVENIFAMDRAMVTHSASTLTSCV